MRALGNHDDRRVPRLEAVLDVLADLLDLEWLLGDEDDVGAAGHPGVQRDPAGVPPITSTISARWWLSAVVCRRSMASIAMFTAVSKPNV